MLLFTPAETMKKSVSQKEELMQSHILQGGVEIEALFSQRFHSHKNHFAFQQFKDRVLNKGLRIQSQDHLSCLNLALVLRLIYYFIYLLHFYATFLPPRGSRLYSIHQLVSQSEEARRASF